MSRSTPRDLKAALAAVCHPTSDDSFEITPRELAYALEDAALLLDHDRPGHPLCEVLLAVGDALTHEQAKVKLLLKGARKRGRHNDPSSDAIAQAIFYAVRNMVDSEGITAYQAAEKLAETGIFRDEAGERIAIVPAMGHRTFWNRYREGVALVLTEEEAAGLDFDDSDIPFGGIR